jgi:hypothetical protein
VKTEDKIFGAILNGNPSHYAYGRTIYAFGRSRYETTYIIKPPGIDTTNIEMILV